MARKMKMIDKILTQKYMYGGELCQLGDIILDLQKLTNNQRQIDAYLMGLFRNQNPL